MQHTITINNEQYAQYDDSQIVCYAQYDSLKVKCTPGSQTHLAAAHKKHVRAQTDFSFST